VQEIKSFVILTLSAGSVIKIAWTAPIVSKGPYMQVSLDLN